jgi:hypothetical protein
MKTSLESHAPQPAGQEGVVLTLIPVLLEPQIKDMPVALEQAALHQVILVGGVVVQVQ